MSDVIDASRTLLLKARELDDLSKKLDEIEIALGPLEAELTEWVEDFHAGCWTAHIEQEAKLPSESIRLSLAHRRKRRISDLKEIVDAQRSIVSALKTEMEASEGPQPAWSPS
jgi:predicted translin family RNA/ssDNA-binding protein